MNKLFVPYYLALLAKEKGFNEECLAIYSHNNGFYSNGTFFLHHPHPFTIEELTPIVQDIREEQSVYILAPIYQQLVDWFRDIHKLKIRSIPYTSGNDKWVIWKWIHQDPDTGYWEEERKINEDSIDKALEEAFKLI